MTLPYADPSNPALPSPLFSDVTAGRGDHLRANNAAIFGDLANLDGRLERIEDLETTASSGGTLTLTVANKVQQRITGTATHTVALPVVSTLYVGFTFIIMNDSTQDVTVNSSGANLVKTILPKGAILLTCVAISGTTAASWQVVDLSGGAISSPVRQTVFTGKKTAAGLPDALAAGAGLSVVMDNTPIPAYVGMAAGFGVDGALNYAAKLDSDITWSALAAYASPWLYLTRAVDGAISADHTIYRPVYGKAFAGAKAGSICATFEGTNGATTYTDEVGDVWTFANGAALSNAVKIFNATTSLYLQGTDDYADCEFPALPTKFWFECVFQATDTTRAAAQCLARGGTTLYSWALHISTAGKLVLYLSSNGSSWDIANGVVGNTTLSDNTPYHVEIDFTGTQYKVYLNGVAESNLTTTSSSAIFAPGKLRLGADYDGLNLEFFGYVESVGFGPMAKHTGNFTNPSAPIATPTTLHWFDTNDYIMYEGNPAAWTAKIRPFIGKCETDASAATNVVTFAYGGKYESDPVACPAVNTATVFNHNIGTRKVNPRAWAECIKGEYGYSPGDRILLTVSDGGSATDVPMPTKITDVSCIFKTGVNIVFAIPRLDANGFAGATAANWNILMTAERAF